MHNLELTILLIALEVSFRQLGSNKRNILGLLLENLCLLFKFLGFHVKFEYIGVMFPLDTELHFESLVLELNHVFLLIKELGQLHIVEDVSEDRFALVI